jgi:hypothetical protein
LSVTSPEFLVTPYFIFTIVFLCLYVILTTFALPKRNSFVFGMLIGILIYSMLIYGIDAKSSENLPEWIVKFASVFYGATLYITLIVLIAIGAVFQQFTNHKAVNWLSGVAIPFSIFEGYFTLSCVGNVPFMENLIQCT